MLSGNKFVNLVPMLILLQVLCSFTYIKDLSEHLHFGITACSCKKTGENTDVIDWCDQKVGTFIPKTFYY